MQSKVNKILFLKRIKADVHIFKTFSTSTSSVNWKTQVPLSQQGGVHGSRVTSSNVTWRTKPLFRRNGEDKVFKTGTEASQLLIYEAGRRDEGSVEFLTSWESMVTSLAVVFDRMPKYAWIMKQLIEPERTITFRVPWIDDFGISRVNRGFRTQYSSALGPYIGGTRFSQHVTMSSIKANAFDTTFVNALAGSFGGAYGGADFNPYSKSETEIQRFCQSYMTELSKYIGPDVDLPGIGDGCTFSEIGYLYGQYKRINHHCGQSGSGLLWAGKPDYIQAQGWSVAYFAKKMLADKGIDLKGKRCIVTGSNFVSFATAEKLLEFGAIPISFSDSSGHIYEENGFDQAKLKTIQRIKSERGAKVGRYIIASTTSKFNEPMNIFDIPCDYVFACSNNIMVNESDIANLSAQGCVGIIEGIQNVITPSALIAAKKKRMLYGPFRATTVAGSIINGLAMSNNPIKSLEDLDNRVEQQIDILYDEIRRTAQEFNTRGDLAAGVNIASFLRVANSMLLHGAV